MSELFIEIFQEEIPARMQVAAEENFARLITDRLKSNGIEFAQFHTYSTPRRIALRVTGIPAIRQDVTEELKGPAVTAPPQAIAGFLKKTGLDQVSQLTTRNIKGTEYYFYLSVKKGGETRESLGAIITDSLINMPWPKSMRWGNNTVRWVRPLHNILAIFDGKIVDGYFDLGDDQKITYNNRTKGHRFMSDGEWFGVSGFADYQSKLLDASVILDRKDRKEKIWEDVVKAASKENFTAREDEKLLDEVVGLVEWPVPFMGKFDDHFLEIPAEVITTSMRENQRYFSVLDQNGTLVNRFITLANVTPDDDGETIIYGNEKVLRARLSDARFFWDQDLKKKLADCLPRLEQIRFHEKLGMMSDKAKRLSTLSGNIAGMMGADMNAAERAGLLCKADLVTGMVREFPEIQGIMGGYYAQKSGETDSVSAAIKTHYAPLGPSESCPTNPVSIAVALADKLDTIVGFFSIDEKPTGSKDPYALRRAALGIIRLLLENNQPLPLSSLLKASAILYKIDTPPDIESFIYDRFKVMMKGEGYPHQIIESVSGNNFVDMKKRISQLAAFIETEKGHDLVATVKRAINILESEEKKQSVKFDGEISESLLQESEEKNLYQALCAVTSKFDQNIAQGNYTLAMTCLADIREKVDLFFDKIIVNDSNPDLKKNRLAVLSNIRDMAHQIADFSKI